MELNKEDERPDVVMTLKDKDDINKFAGRLARRNELRARITRLKKLMQVHEDASDELLMMDDEADVYYNVGDVFIMDDKPSVECSLDETKRSVTKDISSDEDALSAIEKEMLSLKATLYAKFGRTINLEE